MYVDSLYLIQSQRQKCHAILSKDALSDNQKVDVFISLSMILEVSLNALHRQMILRQIAPSADVSNVVKQIDNISFIDKTILFIHSGNFNFGTEIEEAAEHYDLIDKLQYVTDIRDALLQGHTLASLMHDVVDKADLFEKHIQLFMQIMDAMRFFLEHLDNNWTQEHKADLREQYLSYAFIPASYR